MGAPDLVYKYCQLQMVTDLCEQEKCMGFQEQTVSHEIERYYENPNETIVLHCERLKCISTQTDRYTVLQCKYAFYPLQHMKDSYSVWELGLLS